MSGSELIISRKHCSVCRGQHSVTVRTSFALTSVVAQCVSRCSALTTGFLLLLLTRRGAEICSGCFLNEDVKESNYDLDSSPGLDLDNVYNLPILCQHVNHGNDIHLRSTGKDNDKVQEPEEVPADDSSSDSSEAGSTQPHVTNNNKGPVTMNCSHHQFVYLLENLLVFHAMYKCK